jgi:tRNA(fMet)-specific endonuclease VapC
VIRARFLLDTNICIYIRRHRPPEVLARFRALKIGEAVLSVISYGELLYGVEKGGTRMEVLRGFQDLTQVIQVLPLAPEVAQAYGVIRADLERRGQLIGGNDLWIAAHARALGLTLVTNNQREFQRVPGLKLQNWVAPDEQK